MVFTYNAFSNKCKTLYLHCCTFPDTYPLLEELLVVSVRPIFPAECDCKNKNYLIQFIFKFIIIQYFGLHLIFFPTCLQLSEVLSISLCFTTGGEIVSNLLFASVLPFSSSLLSPFLPVVGTSNVTCWLRSNRNKKLLFRRMFSTYN